MGIFWDCDLGFQPLSFDADKEIESVLGRAGSFSFA
jgi:hypothetical protein